MRFAPLPPACVNTPPAQSAGPLPSSKTAKARTVVVCTPLLARPLPSADQPAPSHFATCWQELPPALVKRPPA
jgi:hypothetical protein